jgi:transposase-like protein
MPRASSFNRGHQEKAINLLRDGGSYEDVAKEFGVKPDTVYRLAKRHGVTERKSRSKGKMVAFYLTEEEFEGFSSLVKLHGYSTKSELGRALVRNALGFLEVSDGEFQKFNEVKAQLSKVGTNINQIAKQANRGRIVLEAADKEDLNELKATVTRLNIYLNDLTSEMRRRGSRLWRKSEHSS